MCRSPHRPAGPGGELEWIGRPHELRHIAQHAADLRRIGLSPASGLEDISVPGPGDTTLAGVVKRWQEQSCALLDEGANVLSVRGVQAVAVDMALLSRTAVDVATAAGAGGLLEPRAAEALENAAGEAVRAWADAARAWKSDVVGGHGIPAGLQVARQELADAVRDTFMDDGQWVDAVALSRRPDLDELLRSTRETSVVAMDVAVAYEATVHHLVKRQIPLIPFRDAVAVMGSLPMQYARLGARRPPLLPLSREAPVARTLLDTADAARRASVGVQDLVLRQPSRVRERDPEAADASRIAALTGRTAGRQTVTHTSGSPSPLPPSAPALEQRMAPQNGMRRR